MKNTTKALAMENIEEFFKNILEKTPREVFKIKKIAMKFNIPLKEKRKLFCKKCLTPFNKSKITVKKNQKSIKCRKCSYTSRWKIKRTNFS